MKGPFKSVEAARSHAICNEVKRRLQSKYLHTIGCEIKNYGFQSVFVECEEIGEADLGKVTEKWTKLEGEVFDVLNYNSNDAVPDPLAYLTAINSENRDVWIEVMVNYCFRWIFGIGDTARRSLMLQRSTGKIYSTDETGIEHVSHRNIWGGKKPDKKTFELVKAFAGTCRLNDVLLGVKRWKMFLDPIRREVVPLSRQVEARIDELLKDSKKIFDV